MQIKNTTRVVRSLAFHLNPQKHLILCIDEYLVHGWIIKVTCIVAAGGAFESVLRGLGIPSEPIEFLGVNLHFYFT